METIQVGFTQFIDFLLKGPVGRVSHVKKIKNQPPYSPGTDFWFQLREAIKDIHKNGKDIDTLNNLLTDIHERKLRQYFAAIEGYKKFCRGKEIEWFDVGRSFWAHDRLVVRSTPEMGLIINGVPHRIKLYFKEHREKLDKRRAQSLLTLMSESSSDKPTAKLRESVLNVKSAKLLTLDKTVNETMRLSLETDAQAFCYLWDRV